MASLIESPKTEALLLMKDRFPVPRYVQTFHGESQGRFLLSKLNPSSSSQQTSLYSNNMYGGVGFNQQQAQQPGETILTDDVSLQVFIEYLKKLAVSSASH